MKPIAFRKQAILFDLDGVLVDSKIPVERSWADWAQRNHLDVERVVAESHGRRTIETVQMFTPHLDAEKESAALDHREATDLDGVRAVPGAHELLAKISPERWAVATSGADEVARTRLRALKFPIPRVLISSDSVEHGKPAPEPYLRAAAGLGFAPADCLVIEDAPAGIESARAAGMQVIALTTTFAQAVLERADLVLDDLKAVRVQVAEAELKIFVAASL